MKTEKKPKIKHTKLDTVVVEYKEKRYELYFDQMEYCVFIGQSGRGSLIKGTPEMSGRFEIWPNW